MFLNKFANVVMLAVNIYSSCNVLIYFVIKIFNMKMSQLASYITSSKLWRQDDVMVSVTDCYTKGNGFASRSSQTFVSKNFK